MPEYTLRLPTKLWTRNEQDRQHWAVKQRYKKRTLCPLLLAAMGRKRARMCPAKQHRFVSIVAHVRKRQDPDNLVGSMKPLIDAMRYVGLLYDDNAEWLTLAVAQVTGREYFVDVIVRWA